MKTLERMILAAAREAFNNPRLRMKDIMAFNTGPMIRPLRGEVCATSSGCGFCVRKKFDKRKNNVAVGEV